MSLTPGSVAAAADLGQLPLFLLPLDLIIMIHDSAAEHSTAKNPLFTMIEQELFIARTMRCKIPLIQPIVNKMPCKKELIALNAATVYGHVLRDRRPRLPFY